jgi:predicted nucleotidyltransferase
MTKLLDADTMRKAFQLVDSELKNKARFIVGGGAAMTLAYSHPLATHDVDAFAARGGLSIADVDALAKKIATRLGIAGDWLNSHFDTYTIVLPSDYATRLRRVFNGKQLTVDALGPEDLLIMKCFAARAKDRPHAAALFRHISNFDIVDKQLDLLLQKRYPKAQEAADYFDQLRDSLQQD